MNAKDKTATAALKASVKAGTSPAEREKARDLVKKVVDTEGGAGGDRISQVAEYFMTRERRAEIGSPAPPPFETIIAMSAVGLKGSVEFAWSQLGKELANCDAELITKILRSTPTPRVIESIARARKGLMNEALNLIKHQPELCKDSAVLDWIAAKGTPAQLSEILPIAVSIEERSSQVSSPAELLGLILTRDKTGKLCAEAVKRAHQADAHLRQFNLAIGQYTGVLTALVAALSLVINKEEGSTSLRLLSAGLAIERDPEKAESQRLFGALASFTGRLLGTTKRSAHENEALDIISCSTSQWMRQSHTAAKGTAMWVIARASDILVKTPEGSEVNVQGARLIVSALRKAATGVSAKALLEALALNLGLEPTGGVGEGISFDPVLHEDSVGGLLEGDPVVVEEPGWHLGTHPISRAKVRPKSP